MNGMPNHSGNGTNETRIYSSFRNQLKTWKSEQKCVKKWPLHFFKISWLFNLQHLFSISSFCFKTTGIRLSKMDNLPLQTMSFGFFISLLGAEKWSFKSVSFVLGHTVYLIFPGIPDRKFPGIREWKKAGNPGNSRFPVPGIPGVKL